MFPKMRLSKCKFHLQSRLLSSTTPLNSNSIGFIGLGNMGFSMASNLLKTFPVTVFDINSTTLAKITEKGAKCAPSITELAESCSIIITMVPATQHVVSIMTSQEGIFNHAKAGTLLIDCSTIDPLTSKSLAMDAERRGLRMIDAPVSGGVTGAAAGTLTFMVGGKYDDLKSAEVALLHINM